MKCGHNEDYICPKCGSCFCRHKLEYDGTLWWWTCPLSTFKFRIGSRGEITQHE